MKLVKVSLESILETRICNQLAQERALNREAVTSICQEQGIDSSELATAIRVLSALYSQTECPVHKLIDAMGELLGNNSRYHDEVLLAENLATEMFYGDR